nr:tRNA lysidine(34) synthetase TilS [Altererythrobacter sp. KTW20L]
MNPEGGKIGLAVSGGPDSMAMLLLAHEAIPGGFEVATVNHGLRPEAADECALVERACAERGVACAVLAAFWNTMKNVQASARRGRYQALGEWAEQRGLTHVATAHHADDQAETLLMRLNRGSGVAGLAGVREDSCIDAWPEIGLIRPLLTFRRQELTQVVECAGVPVVLDPSNSDDRYDRVRIRKVLADAVWLDPVALVRSASNLADAEDALDMFGRELWGRHITLDDGAYRFCQPYVGTEMQMRLVRRIFASLGSEPRGSELAHLIERLQAHKSANLGGVLATVEGDDWLFRPEPPRRSG